MRTKIQVRVGERTALLLSENFRPSFDPKLLPDDTPVIWPSDDRASELFDVVYDGEQRAVEFPHARLVWMQQTASLLEESGWIVEAPPPAPTSLKRAIEGGNQTAADAVVGKYAKGSVAAAMTISSLGQGFSAALAGRPGYVLDLTFSDQALHESQSNKMYRERLRVNGTIDRSLPLAYWLK